MRYFSIFPIIVALAGSPSLAADPLSEFKNELQQPKLSAEQRLALAESITKHTAWSAGALAQFYYTGEGLESPNKDRALAMFELSAQLGDAYSAYSAFLGHVQGWASQSDPSKASPYLWQAAKADIRQSRMYLAEGYRTGNYGLPLDLQAAMQWAYTTEVSPQMHLDMCLQEDPLYLSQHCVNEWVKPAALQGDAIASYRMGLQFQHGISMLNPDLNEANTWFEKAGNYGPALLARGDLLFAQQESISFTKDDSEQMKSLLFSAAQAGELRAFTELAYVMIDGGEADSALALLSQADIVGSCDAACKYQLSVLLENSEPENAEAYLQSAMSEGDANALLETSLKQAPDLPDTRARIYQAAIKGNVTAMLWLMDRANESGDKEQAIIWRQEAAAFQDRYSQFELALHARRKEGWYEALIYWKSRNKFSNRFEDDVNVLADSGRPEVREDAIQYAKRFQKSRYQELKAQHNVPNYYLEHNRLLNQLKRVRFREYSLSPWRIVAEAPDVPQIEAYNRTDKVPRRHKDGRLAVDGAWNPPEKLPFKLLANNQSVQQSHCGYLFNRATGDHLLIHRLKGGCRPEPSILARLEQEGAKKLVHNDAASAALFDDGSVVTWGGAMAGGSPILAASNFEDSAYKSLDDELKVYRRLQANIVDIAPVQSHFLALDSSGNILLWGPMAYHFGSEIKGDYQALAASPDSDRFCALSRNGDVACWDLGGGASPRVIAHNKARVMKVEGTFDTFAMLDEQGQLTLQSIVMNQGIDDLLPTIDKSKRWKKLEQVVVYGRLRTLLIDMDDKLYYIKPNHQKLELKSVHNTGEETLFITSNETMAYLN
ncbi:hypothetical protein [Vibrio hyugaensis]|uniref:hypothetical protein n=1 Tax=Vibrio hyugaensis TaxID=1534743 RepID=UPI000CE2FAE9|nr:hypothetical protein [Vibrio hyugaensis]